MSKLLDAEMFLQKLRVTPVIDVRFPGEFAQGHIPDAYNIPLFTDDERTEIGTIYKNTGQKAAISRGFELAEPKLTWYARESKKVAHNNEILVHCWRGGMRSESFAGLCEAAGIRVSVLKGGYKAYRRFIRKKFGCCRELIVLSGLTGCGKTEILHELERLGEQVVDLEGVAQHKGSAFGSIGQREQPTNQQFENDIAAIWQNFDMSQRIWIEDESRHIGKAFINEVLFEKMKAAFFYIIEIPDKFRIKRLERDYCVLSSDALIQVVNKMQKRLGLQRVKKAVKHLESGECRLAISVLLTYYDKKYADGIRRRGLVFAHSLRFQHEESAPNHIAKTLIDFANNKNCN